MPFNSTYLFPDLEVELVQYFTNVLGEIARIGTKKLPGDQTQDEIVINVSYSGDKDRTLKYAGVVLDIYSADYETCTGLALAAECVLRGSMSSSIKSVDVLSGPVRMDEPGPAEHRSISAELVVKATDFIF
jgi:hypothetical protein